MVKKNFKRKKNFLGKLDKPRISIFRSNKAIYAQLIDDQTGKTLTYSSSQEKKLLLMNQSKTKMEISNEVGKLLGERAKKLNIKKVVFDKGRYLYHGRVKSLAEGAREKELDF
ncbi:50S ribosomal protein L18 [Blattabacterium cuenoti]|uniref:50S ribosomal protein L18 n=1 Tax=Blattabacterium cuenoti TaxID=1653831 RepID=UPI00163C2547|nr:50S ribosomal protein L18 [Blattabacterium cuenoti]